jgi:hypothetical protein
VAYDLILGESPRRWSRGDCGDEPFLWTPSAVRAEVARTRGLLDLADREVRQAAADKKVSAAELATWTDAYKAGRKFTDSASSLWGSNVAPSRQLGLEAERWRALVRQRGGAAAAPADAGKLAPPEPRRLSATHVALLGIGGASALALLISALKR